LSSVSSVTPVPFLLFRHFPHSPHCLLFFFCPAFRFRLLTTTVLLL
jgi:hypothetical protein